MGERLGTSSYYDKDELPKELISASTGLFRGSYPHQSTFQPCPPCHCLYATMQFASIKSKCGLSVLLAIIGITSTGVNALPAPIDWSHLKDSSSNEPEWWSFKNYAYLSKGGRQSKDYRQSKGFRYR